MTVHILMKGITKDFPGTRALDGADFEIFGGEIHAVVGENGAGKSTLMKILSGNFSDYAGSIEVSGEVLRIENHQTAKKLGITMIYQELLLVPRMTVAQNIYLGREPLTRSGMVDKKKQAGDARRILESLKVPIDPNTQVFRLSPAERQVVEIAKAFAGEPKVLIMDEPTSSLHQEEIETLFEILRELKKRGVAVIFISHKIDEVMDIADRVTVLRDGEVVTDELISETNEHKIIQAMVGREIKDLYPSKNVKIGEIILLVRNFSSGNLFQNIQFELHHGEILGFYGLIGSGRTEVAEALFGLNANNYGIVEIRGKNIKCDSVQRAVRTGLFLLPEDRRGKGFIPRMSVESNLTLANLINYSRGMVVNSKLKQQNAIQMIKKLKIKTASYETPVEFLSGGNQQKVVVGKCLLTNPDIIIMDEPTRGIDVGTKAEIYEWIVNLADEGKGIILISSELPEILGLSDRILVFCEGSIAQELTREEANPEIIMYYATGTSMVQKSTDTQN